MVCNISSLPDEVLEHIFSFLDSRTMLAASSTSKRWMQVINSNPQLLEDVCVCFMAFSLKRIYPLFSKMSRKFCNFYFKYVDIDRECFDFLKKFAPQFRRLFFSGCSILVDFEPHLQKIHECHNLYELRMIGCNVLGMFSHLPGLKSLHFQVDSTFTQRDLVQLNQMTPPDLADFGMVVAIMSDQEFMRKYYSEVADFLRQRATYLRSLDLSGMDFPDANIINLSKIEGLRLTRFRMIPCFHQAGTIQTFLENQQGIVTLELGDMRTLKDDALAAICATLPEMTELSLHSCTSFNKSIAAIFKLKRLRKLDLSNCHGIKRESFRNALDQLACTELETINLRELIIDRFFLSRLLPLVPNLREINLTTACDLGDASWVKYGVPGVGCVMRKQVWDMQVISHILSKSCGSTQNKEE